MRSWKLSFAVIGTIITIILMCIFGVQSNTNKAISLEESVEQASSDIKVQEKSRLDKASTKHTGTIYTRLDGRNISDNSIFFENKAPEQALKTCTSGIGNIIFWMIWVLLTSGIVFGFCYFENEWLED